jgi:hypothetical protein
LDPERVREGELSRRVRSAAGKVRQARRRGALGRHHERIFRSTPPSDEPELGVVSCGTPRVLKRPDGVVEEHHAEARNDHVEGCRRALRFGTGPAAAIMGYSVVSTQARPARPFQSVLVIGLYA